ncbi:uncharacterized protein [Dendrobates tinctorius]|uniref:uncharacterized protein n=1 Tax=Dendrobates tinctorius TaxID=92724 RepID=UPI003CCA6310
MPQPRDRHPHRRRDVCSLAAEDQKKKKSARWVKPAQDDLLSVQVRTRTCDLTGTAQLPETSRLTWWWIREEVDGERHQRLYVLKPRSGATHNLQGILTDSTISDPLSEDLLQKRIFLIYPSRMDMDRDKMTERMLHLTLEILFHLTGEDYTVVKKTSSDRCQDPVSEGWGSLLSPITGTPPHPLIHEDINDQKILDLTYKMIELLTGEVPIRCQDVAIYFSMEEWEYLEGHRDLYKNVIMEVPQPLTSPGNRQD